MSLGRPKPTLKLSAEEQETLTGFASSRSLPHALVSRARVVLWSVEGISNAEIAERLNWSKATVGKWRQRFIDDRVQGLYDELRPGRPRTVSDEQVAVLLRRTLKSQPPAGTHWSVRQAADANQLSKSTVHRVFRTFAVQPHRSKSFKLSTDPFFIEKVRDIVGLYLNPPDHAMVLAVDEKSQIQALSRTQPVLPMGLGYVEGVTHDYVRHGTTTLFAALDIATGTVLTDCKPRHRHQEFLSFLKRIDTAVPAQLDVHLIVDNYATHKHATVRTWLGERPRFHIHYTPTYSSWLNQVERWFGLITQQAIRRGSFRSVRQLVARINQFVQHYNRNCRPFTWTATADSILEKLARLCHVFRGHHTRYQAAGAHRATQPSRHRRPPRYGTRSTRRRLRCFRCADCFVSDTDRGKLLNQLKADFRSENGLEFGPDGEVVGILDGC
jgi:putative transposase